MARHPARSALTVLWCCLLAACGSSAPGIIQTSSPQATAVQGTAAVGAPLRATTITLSDAQGTQATGTSGEDGSFSVDTTGLTPPFLLRSRTPRGQQLYSISADASASATVNLTPLTDLVVRLWYGARGLSVDGAFADASQPRPRDWAIAVTRSRSLIAPGSMPWEFGNALSALIKRGLLDTELAVEATKAFHRIPIQIKAVELERALPLAAQMRMYAYDAYMLQCARQYDSPLLTFDHALQVHARTLGIELLEEPA